MRHGLISSAVTLAVLAAACTTTTQPGAPLAAGLTCEASQLEMRLIFVGFATGNVEGIVDIRNKSTHDCVLSGYPGLQLLDAARRPLPTLASDTTTSFFQSSPVSAVVVTLSAGTGPINPNGPTAGHAYIDMSWSDGSPPCEQPSSFAITPPAASRSIEVSAIPPIPGTPAPYICGGGAVAVLPIQRPKGMSYAQVATDCRAGGLCDGGAVYVNLTEPAEAD